MNKGYRNPLPARTANQISGRLTTALLCLVAAVSVFWIPIIGALARSEWATDQGAHGPLIMATSIWLLVREVRSNWQYAALGRMWSTASIAVPGLLIYAIGSRSGIAWIQALGGIIAILALFHSLLGPVLMAKIWFPIVYFFFNVPPPVTLTGPFLSAAKLEIARLAVKLLQKFGYEVAGSGASIYIDQYEVRVAAACAGLNSLVSLLAIGLLYIFLMHKAHWKYSAILAIAIFPLALIANFTRVVLLLLATHYLGEGFAQGAFHEAAGLTMFIVTLAGLVLIDRLVGTFYAPSNNGA